MNLSPLRTTAAAVLVAATAGCGPSEPRAYVAPKDSAPPAAANERSAARGSAPWRVPEGWSEKPDTSGMRQASYGVTTPDGRSADISIVALNSSGGAVLDNVNRWRGQIQLDPIAEDQLSTGQQTARIGNRDAALFDIVSDKPVLDGKFKARTLAAILPAGDLTVFFKITGEDQLVQENRAKFLEFLRSVNTGSDSDDPPARSTPPPTSAAVENPPPIAQPQWTPPPGWTPAPASSMRVASFSIQNEQNAKADMSVVALGPSAGSTLSNVNRWRGQIGLNPLSESDLKTQVSEIPLPNGGAASLVDIAGAGDSKNTRLLAAIVARPDRTWFYKMTGDDALVASQKQAFTAFVQSVRYP